MHPTDVSTDTDREWLTPAEVSARLGIHVHTIRRYAREGRLPSRKFGSKTRIHASALQLDTAPPDA